LLTSMLIRYLYTHDASAVQREFREKPEAEVRDIERPIGSELQAARVVKPVAKTVTLVDNCARTCVVTPPKSDSGIKRNAAFHGVLRERFRPTLSHSQP
jgi:hypothetical protein